MRSNLVTAQATERESYEKIRFRPDHVEEAYAFAKRKSLGDKLDELTGVLLSYKNTGIDLLDQIVSDFQYRVDAGKKIP